MKTLVDLVVTSSMYNSDSYIVVGDVVLAGNFNLEKLFFPEKTFNILTKVASRRMLCLGKLFLKKLFFRESTNK